MLNIIGGGTDGYLDLGADTDGTGKTTFNFSGGKLLVSSTLQGTQATGARQAFVWTGGMLVARTINATNLTSADGQAYAGNAGTLVNAGGTLLPGDSGNTGLTAITGNYTQSATSTLGIGIAGTTASTAFQDVGLSKFDTVTVSGTSSLNGTISIDFIPGYTPVFADSFSVLSSTGVLTAAGGDFAGSVTKATSEGFSTMLVTTTAGVGGSVVLNNYTITNQWSGTGTIWGSAGAPSWTSSDPNANTVGAYFTNTPGTVTLDQNRTVKNITFAPASGAFTLNSSGGAILTLDAGVGTIVSAINNRAGSNTINAPIALATNAIVGAQAGGTLTLGGVISGTGTGLIVQGTSTSVVSLGGANTYTGLVDMRQGTTLVFSVVGNTDTANSLGQSSSDASNLLLANIAILRYVGSGGSTDRLFTINGAQNGHYAIIESNGTGALNFTNTGNLGWGIINQPRTLILDGTNTDANTLSATLTNNGTGAVSVTKQGVGMWALTGTNTNTGNLNVNAGTLRLTGTCTSSNAIVASGAILSSGFVTTSACNNLTFSALASVYQVNAITTTTASKLTCATLTASSGFTINCLGALNSGQTIPILISTSGTPTPTLGTNTTGQTVTFSWSGNTLRLLT